MKIKKTKIFGIVKKALKVPPNLHIRQDFFVLVALRAKRCEVAARKG